MKAVYLLLTATMMALMAMAEGGVFEPDNVVRTDTVTVVRVDTVYFDMWDRPAQGCGILEDEDTGAQVMATHARRRTWRSFHTLNDNTGSVWKVDAYRTCDGRTVTLAEPRVFVVW